MSFRARLWVIALVVGMGLMVAAPAAQGAFGVERFYSLTCNENEPEGEPEECNPEVPEEFYKQAGGHPNFGITDLTFKGLGLEGNGVKSIRTDLPVGFATSPQALPECTQEDFAANLFKAEESHCNPNTQAGTQEVTIIVENVKKEPEVVTYTGKVYNLVPAPGLPLEFGIDTPIAAIGGLHVHSFLEGGVSWRPEKEATEEGIESGDYHEYFKIKVHKSLAEKEAPVIRSRLIFNGEVGNGTLLTLPTTCPGPQTTHVRVEPYVGPPAFGSFKSAPTSEEENCAALAFEPAFVLTPSSTQFDQPIGLTTDLAFPFTEEFEELENSQLRTAVVKLPEGVTINPAAVSGLEACTPEQFAVAEDTAEPAVGCPDRSAIGAAVLNVPGLPPESLTGKVYLGEKEAGPITAPPYTIFVAVGSKRYGQLVRLEGAVEPNPLTGQLTATFANQPQGPFRDIKLTFNGGQLSDLANPLNCGEATTTSEFVPYSGVAPLAEFSPQSTKFVVDGDGSEGPCPSPVPVNWTQTASSEPAQGGASSTFTFNIERLDGNQYLSQIKTVLPPGLLGTIPAVTLCTEAQASSDTCPASSRIGSVSVAAGAGTQPHSFSGTVFLTESFEGAPYGLSIVVPASAGPFKLGNVRARATVSVDPHTARVTLNDTKVPMVVGGVPTRVKSLTVTIDRQGFERNPTSCAELKTESTLTGSLGGTAALPTPFQAQGCESLAFKPSFSASSSATVSKANGASLEVKIAQAPGQANFRSTVTSLPKALPSRLTTLQKACLEATFAANPLSCPEGSQVGTATAVTPVLPTPMTGPAYLVSHGGAAFPDLDLVLEGSGVRVILVGNTDIKNGITTTTFATVPDAPVTSFTLKLPRGPHSALTANTDLCAHPLTMPTTLTAQNGKSIKQNTKISVSGCGVKIVGHKVVGRTAFITVKTFAAGRITGSGRSLRTATRRLSRASNAATLKMSLTNAGRRRHRPLRTRLRVGFVPSKRGAHSSASVTLVFR
jgi:hypothetical protein